MHADQVKDSRNRTDRRHRRNLVLSITAISRDCGDSGHSKRLGNFMVALLRCLL